MSSDEQRRTRADASADAEETADATDTGADQVADAEPEVEGGAEERAGRSSAGPPGWLVPASAAFALAAFVVAAVFAVMWWVASGSDDAEVAGAREDVVRAAGNAVTALTELDYENPDAYFERQKTLATDELRKTIEQSEKSYRDAIAKAKTKVVSTVQDVAVEELNVHEGKASALATVSLDVTQGDKQSTKALRLELQLTRVDENGEQVWKLANMGEVPVVGTGQ
ncbi:hypothetical protein SacmaDRAFT_0678 [Saccharomonospora marina XMU15]|uniref:Mce-associated membrane protein n=1 Tax=Saccharomonospora marina XMU15 TaxID=882083 RepID=H5X689_9PSEU|nr:hypothetical protein [Saccharomonospora marina]EHR48974.1 hypothetical protein SacmaDRAFT_0678 [Saccharomonospora marina XMU15]